MANYTQDEVRKALREAADKEDLAKHMEKAGMKEKADNIRQDADNQRSNYDGRGK